VAGLHGGVDPQRDRVNLEQGLLMPSQVPDLPDRMAPGQRRVVAPLPSVITETNPDVQTSIWDKEDIGVHQGATNWPRRGLMIEESNHTVHFHCLCVALLKPQEKGLAVSRRKYSDGKPEVIRSLMAIYVSPDPDRRRKLNRSNPLR